MPPNRIIVIGASSGGIEALADVVAGLPVPVLEIAVDRQAGEPRQQLGMVEVLLAADRVPCVAPAQRGGERGRRGSQCLEAGVREQ